MNSAAARFRPRDLVEVELDLGSSRPNPQWWLDTRAARRLLVAVDAAPHADASRVENDPGYRGLVVSVSDGRIIRIRRGTIEVTGETGVAEPIRRADPDRALERWLLDTGRTMIGDPEYAAVTAGFEQ
ncbi:hypothetical protein [Nocardia jejuensis]|uniref:hypothetical protein n=1 Tax=Nocardia jejuensis TaxID=328049 RepID=UPI0012F81918|nr:hypothetical protein [Nocardia jejuensis]